MRQEPEFEGLIAGLEERKYAGLKVGRAIVVDVNVAAEYRKLIDWVKQSYRRARPSQGRRLDGIQQLRGMGRTLWQGEDPDDYVRKLRESSG